MTGREWEERMEGDGKVREKGSRFEGAMANLI